MSWSDLVLALLLVLILNGIIGCILYGAWRGILRLIAARMDIQAAYIILRLIIAVFLIPLPGIALLGTWAHNGYISDITILMSRQQIRWIVVLLLIWIAGTAALCVKQFLRWKETVGLVALGSMPASRVWLDPLKKMCVRLKLHRTIRARERFLEKSVFVTGVLRPVVYLPTGDFTDDEREVILLHELTHVCERDLGWKIAADLTKCIYWPFYPVWKIGRDVNDFSEFNCDYRCCGLLGGARDYFALIERMLEESVRWFQSPWLSYMAKDRSELYDRIRSMINQQRLSPVRRGWIFAAAFAFLILGSTTVSASTYSIMREYRLAYWENLSLVYEEGEDPVQQEEQILQDGWQRAGDLVIRNSCGWLVEPEEAVSVPDTMSGFLEWDLDAKTAFTSEPIIIDADQEWILGCGPDPEGEKIPVGLIYPNGSLHYVFMSSDGMQVFCPGESGEYRLFVGNVTDHEINMGGYWMTRRRERL